jgi:hypothetical protein
MRAVARVGMLLVLVALSQTQATQGAHARAAAAVECGVLAVTTAVSHDTLALSLGITRSPP